VSIQKVAERLLELERDNGRLAPADVVEAARDPESPLHSHFNWDDSDAAEKYRLMQARTLIRTVKLEITVRDVPLSVVGYVRDPEADAKTAGYRNVAKLRTEEDAARAAIVDEMKRVSNAVRRAKGLAAVLGVAEDIEQIDVIAKGISERVSPAVDAPSAAA
jgi:hypothetical protein